MLAALYAEGETRVTEPTPSRDHSERMFRYFGADLEVFPGGVAVRGGKALEGREINVPGDISSAAFFIVAALIVPGSELLIRGVGVNHTRTGILDILRDMGGSIELVDPRELSGEPVADILVRSSDLRGVEIAGDVVPRAIDEFPVISVAAAVAAGKTVIREARELRVKETDRIAAMASNLRRAGIEVLEADDGMEITGGGSFKTCSAESHGDHRIAMSMLVAGLASSGEISVDDIECIATSFPTFIPLLEKVAQR
jgi:3-phosphoshikimate 1-carboxyvinyltransferase